MSLINEALKKAQRVHNEDAGNPSASGEPGGPRIIRRGRADNTNTMVLIGSGALVLVVLSVVVTVYIVNRPMQREHVVISTPVLGTKEISSAPLIRDDPAPPILAAKNAPPVLIPTAPEATHVAATSTVISLPASIIPPASPAELVRPPSSSVSAPVSASPSAPVKVEAVEAPPPAPALAPDAPDERIAAFVEAIRVTGIRSSGTESRVLMNERVYRVNDIVERTLNVRLIKAAADNLTFTDPRGVIYVKRL